MKSFRLNILSLLFKTEIVNIPIDLKFEELLPLIAMHLKVQVEIIYVCDPCEPVTLCNLP